MRHRYTRQELESITHETPIYLEGVGLAHILWGGWEIAQGCRDGMLYCKHVKPYSLDLYDKYWEAFDGPPEEDLKGKATPQLCSCGPDRGSYGR